MTQHKRAAESFNFHRESRQTKSLLSSHSTSHRQWYRLRSSLLLLHLPAAATALLLFCVLTGTVSAAFVVHLALIPALLQCQLLLGVQYELRHACSRVLHQLSQLVGIEVASDGVQLLADDACIADAELLDLLLQLAVLS